MVAIEMRRLVVVMVEMGPPAFVKDRRELPAGAMWDLAPGKPLGLAYTCQILARWALALSLIKLSGTTEILPQDVQGNALFVVKRKENESQQIARKSFASMTPRV
jgi:hypothetical protein